MSELPVSACEIADAVRVIAAGGIVCFPTETTYGLAVDLRVAGALDQLVAVKGRAAGAPIALIAANLAAAQTVVASWPERASELAAEHWPGALTLVVPARPDLPAAVRGPHGVGVRVSSHPWASALALAVGAPITATSANPPGERPALDVAVARGFFGDQIELYLDAGPSAEVAASTVVVVDEANRVRVLRRGVIDIDER